MKEYNYYQINIKLNKDKDSKYIKYISRIGNRADWLRKHIDHDLEGSTKHGNNTAEQ